MLSPKSVLITGCNRGLGLELVKHFLKLQSPPTHLFATCRAPENAKDLQELAVTNPSIHIIKLEATEQASIDSARASVESILEGFGLNLIINNAAIAKLVTLDEVKTEDMMEHYHVNCVAPLMVTKAFLPCLKRAARADHDKPMSCSRAAIINISSGVASIGENSTGGSYAYRAAKAGLNMVTSNLAIDLKSDGILATAVHPGWVKTDMGGPNALISTDESATLIMNVLAKLQGEEGTGKFYHAKGHIIGW